MAKIAKYASAYLLWIVDLGLTFWLVFLSRTVFLGVFALSYTGGQSVYAEVVYAHRLDFADKIFSIILGLAWLVFMIAVEAYFRAGVSRNDLFRRFARVTGPVLLGVFCVDIILFWLQSIGGGDLLRWFLLAAELGLGIALLLSARTQSKPNPT